MQADPAIESRPEVRALTTEIAELETRAALPVNSPAEYESAVDLLRHVKAAQKRLELTRTGMTGPLNETLRRINDFFRGPGDRLLAAERSLKAGLVAFDQAQERIRIEAQRRADEEARQARAKAEAEAAAARAKADAEARELRAKAEAEAAAGRAAEAAKLQARAEVRVERAEAKADALQTAATMAVAPVVQSARPKVAGVATREVWTFRVEDETKVPREFLTIDESKLRRYVAAMKGDAKVAGVRIYSERQVAARAGGAS
jgi:hypothetical protein